MAVEVLTIEVEGGLALAGLGGGSGRPVVLVSGWSGTAETYRPQVEAWSATNRVVAVDHRGHGRSDRPDDGYRVHRLAADLRAVLGRLGLEDATLLGHSMGVAVIWAHLDLFGWDHLHSLVLVDQMPCALAHPSWSDDERARAGATIDAAGLFEFTDGLRAPGGEATRAGFLRSVTSEGLDADRLERLETESAQLPLVHAADLLHDTATRDWRPFVPLIDLPTLVVGGDSPNVPLDSQRWIHEQIAGSRFEVVEGVTGGTHYPFVERPEAFNEVVADFLATT